MGARVVAVLVAVRVVLRHEEGEEGGALEKDHSHTAVLQRSAADKPKGLRSIQTISLDALLLASSVRCKKEERD